MSILAKLGCLLLLVSLMGIQFAQVHHPEHAEPGVPCFQADCGPTTPSAHDCDDCPVSTHSGDSAQNKNHHHHDFGCCSHVAINALDAVVGISLCPPPPTLALLGDDDRIPGESPVFVMDKPPLIRA